MSDLKVFSELDVVGVMVQVSTAIAQKFSGNLGRGWSKGAGLPYPPHEDRGIFDD